MQRENLDVLAPGQSTHAPNIPDSPTTATGGVLPPIHKDTLPTKSSRPHTVELVLTPHLLSHLPSTNTFRQPHRCSVSHIPHLPALLWPPPPQSLLLHSLVWSLLHMQPADSSLNPSWVLSLITSNAPISATEKPQICPPQPLADTLPHNGSLAAVAQCHTPTSSHLRASELTPSRNALPPPGQQACPLSHSDLSSNVTFLTCLG